jgi:hypothetical protein
MKLIKSIRVPLLVLVALEGIGAASLAWAAQELPAKVASHFNAQGLPDGWMSRSQNLSVMGAIGLILPLFILGTGLLTAAIPSGSINLPNRDYWLGPEHRDETVGYIARHMVWLACLAAGLMIALNYAIVEANRANPPHLSNAVWVLLGVFLIGVTIWSVILIMHFAGVPSTAE